MTAAPVLRVVAGGKDAGYAPAPEVVLTREAGAPAPPVAVADRPAAGEAPPRRRVLPTVLALSLVAHGVAIGVFELGERLDAERSAGGSADHVVIEGIAVELVASVPVPPTLPSVAATDATDIAETVDDEVAAVLEAETVTAETDTVAVRADLAAEAEPVDADAPPPEAQAAEMPPPDEATPVDDTIRPKPEEDTVVAAVEAVAPPPAEKPRLLKTKPERAVPAKSAPPPPVPAAAATAKAKGAGAGTVGCGGKSDGQGRASASSYRAKVTAHLQRRRFYPNEAKRGRLGGTAVVRFTLNARGGVVSAKIVRSTGHAVLDRAALAMVKRASPFPAIPAGLGASITIEAPIRFEPPR